MITEKFTCIECNVNKSSKMRIYGTNWCFRCYDNELMRSYREDSVCLYGDYPTVFKRPQRFNISPDEYKKYGY